MSKRVKTALQILSVLLSVFIAVFSAFVISGEIVRASDARPYLDEYISHFQNLNNGSVSYRMDSDGRYRIDKNDDSEFKILQITDVHLTGYDQNNGWGNGRDLTNSDRQEILAVYRLIEKTRPDIIVMTGDIIYGGDFNTISGNKRALQALVSMMNKVDVPWIYLFGNHDHHFADGYMGENCRDFIYSNLRQANSLLFYDRYNPFYPSDSGDFLGAPEYMYGSYKLYNHDGSLNSMIIGLDSGSNTIYDADYDYIYDSQVDWYEDEIRSVAAANGLAPSDLSTYLYYHIPLNAIQDAFSSGDGSVKYGTHPEDVCSSRHSDPLWNRVRSLESTRVMSFGHDHANDVWMKYDGIDCIYGKSIEYSCYDWDKMFPERAGRQRGATEIHIGQDRNYYITENSLDEIYKNSFVLESTGIWRWENAFNGIDYHYTGSGWNGYENAYMKDGILTWNGGDGNHLISVYSNTDFSASVSGNSSKNGANVEIENTNNGGMKEAFNFEKISDRIYAIKTYSSGLSCALTADSASDNANVSQRTYTGSDLQQWQIARNADGSVSLLLAADPSKALDLSGALPASSGRNLHIYGVDLANPDTAGFELKDVSNAFSNTDISYSTHVQNIGWQSSAVDGMQSGTTGESLRLEGIKISLPNQKYSGSVQYRTHIQNIGWESDWKENGQMSGTTGQSLRLEAIQIQLTGEIAEHYDIYYRVHAQNFGWLGWAKNGESAGTEGCAYRLEAIQIQLVDKGKAAPGDTANAFRHPDVSYTAHVQNLGWQTNAFDGGEAGTTGKGLRLEGIIISLPEQKYSGSIQYRTHIQNIGWEKDWKENGAMSGTSGQSLRLEAIQIRLTGEMSEHYDIYYRVHAQNFGWLGWAKNGEAAGTAGYSYRLESIQIKLVAKNSSAPGNTENAFPHRGVSYTTYVQNYGWQENIYDGGMAGTEGKSLRLEGIRIFLPNQEYSGNIRYRTHIQNLGWENDWKENGQLSGLPGQSLRLEAVQIKLTGEIADHYDVYYRVHAQDLGWMGWTKNGESAGTEGHSYRVEAIQIQLVKKGTAEPESATEAFVKYKTINHPAETHVEYHDTTYKTVHHDAETHIEHHDAVTHTETISHPGKIIMVPGSDETDAAPDGSIGLTTYWPAGDNSSEKSQYKRQFKSVKINGEWVTANDDGTPGDDDLKAWEASIAEQGYKNWDMNTFFDQIQYPITTETRTIVDKDAWDETITDQAAYDEQIVDKPAWEETVVDKEAWSEIVVDK